MYSFYFGNLLLPVTPSKLTVKIKGNNKTLTLVNEGEINFLRQPGLTEISFDALLPMLGAYPFSGSYQRPDYYLSVFEKLMAGATPFRFIVSRVSPSGALLFDTNMKVSLENYTVVEDASKGLDMTVSVSLKQYIDYATKTVTVTKSETGTQAIREETKRETSGAPSVKTYTVQKGDCLWSIARKFYGNGALYTRIYEANRDQLKNAHTLYGGTVLVIP